MTVFAGFEEPDGYCFDVRIADSCWCYCRPLVTRETASLKSVLRPWAARRLGSYPRSYSKFLAASARKHLALAQRTLIVPVWICQQVRINVNRERTN
jgi:hypothetical protein